MDFLRTDANIVYKLFAKDEKHIVTIILYIPKKDERVVLERNTNNIVGNNRKYLGFIKN